MSSISSGISGAGNGLYQLLQRVGGSQASAPASSADAAGAAGGDANGNANGVARSHRHHHHHGGGGGQFFQKIESAVSSALQSAQSNGSSDPNKVVEDAIASVLKQGRPGGQPGGPDGTPGTPGTPGGTPPAGQDGGTSTTAPAGGQAGDASAARQAFEQLLQSHGIDAQQFHDDFAAAIRDARGGNPNPATAFKSFPPGLSVDTTA